MGADPTVGGKRTGVRFASVTKRYGTTVALAGLDLDVAPGELLVLVGPSGSGKSTALRVLAGLETADDGSVEIGDRDVTAEPPHRRDVAMVFQDYALFPHLTAEQNIAFGLRVRRVGDAELRRRVDEVAALLGLDGLLARFPDQLSGGQQQRVALARAMVRDPAVYLMDEPLSNLDAQLRLQTRADIVELHRRLGTTTVYVTHDQAEAMTMGDRVAVLNEGRLEQVAPPQAVYDEPASLFVAAFIGSPPMNLVPGGGVLGGEPGTVLGVRPEDLRIAGPDEAALVEASVGVVEHLGSETVLVVHPPGDERLAVRTGPRATYGVDDRVRLVVERCHVFDAATGARREAGGEPGREAGGEPTGGRPGG